MFKSIAVAYDGSDGSRIAFEKALELKQALPDLKLSIIYVNEEPANSRGFYQGGGDSASVMSPPVDTTYAQYIPPEMGDSRLRNPRNFVDTSGEYSKHMHNSIQQQLDAKGIDGNVLALEGNASKTIAAFVEEQKIDLLVVGNSGKSGLQKFFVGSVSKKLLRDSPCSVLVVK